MTELNIIVRDGARQFARARDLCINLLGKVEDERMRLTLSTLGQYANDRGMAISILSLHRKPIDAEILLRTYQETFIRMMFLALSPKPQWTELLDEFWIGFKLKNLIRHLRTSEALKESGFSDLVSGVDLDLLDSGALDGLCLAMPRKERRRLQQKWGFSQLLVQVAGFLDQEGVPRETVKMHSRLYGVASSLGHADELALKMVLPDSNESGESREFKETCQVARITGDLMDIPALFAMCLTILLQEGSSELEALQKAGEPVQAQISQYMSAQ